MSTWISTTERLPEISDAPHITYGSYRVSEQVLVYAPLDGRDICVLAEHGPKSEAPLTWEGRSGAYGLAEITHWMPLPDPPAS